MDKGYVSKTNIEEYNQYFSNFVSNQQHQLTFDQKSLDTDRIMGAFNHNSRADDDQDIMIIDSDILSEMIMASPEKNHKKGKRKSNYMDMSVEYNTAGERVINRKELQIDKPNKNLEVVVERKELEYGPECSRDRVSSGNGKELVQTIRRSSNKDLIGFYEQTDISTPGKSKNGERKKLFGSNENNLHFSNSFGEEPKILDSCLLTKEYHCDDDMCLAKSASVALLMKKKLKKQVSSSTNTNDRLNFPVTISEDLMPIVDIDTHSSYNTEESSMLQPSSSVVNMLQSLPRSSRLENQSRLSFNYGSEENLSKPSSPLKQMQEMSFGDQAFKKSHQTSTSTLIHNKQLILNTLDNLTSNSYDNSMIFESDDIYNLDEHNRNSQKSRAPFTKMSVPNIHNLQIQLPGVKSNESESQKENFKNIQNNSISKSLSSKNSNQQVNNYQYQDNFDTFDNSKIPKNKILAQNAQNEESILDSFSNKTQAIKNRISQKAFKNWNKISQSNSPVSENPNKNLISSNQFSQLKLNLDIPQENTIDAEDTTERLHTKKIKKNVDTKHSTNCLIKNIDLQDTKRNKINSNMISCKSYIDLNNTMFGGGLGRPSNVLTTFEDKHDDDLDNTSVYQEILDPKQMYYGSQEGSYYEFNDYYSNCQTSLSCSILDQDEKHQDYDSYQTSVHNSDDYQNLAYLEKSNASDYGLKIPELFTDLVYNNTILSNHSNHDKHQEEQDNSQLFNSNAQSYKSEFPMKQFESNSGFRVSFYSFLKEIFKIKDMFLNFELKIALDHYSDREEFKFRLINFFYTKNIMNKSYFTNLLPWRNCQNYWLTNYASDLKIENITNFVSEKCKKQNQYAWMSKLDTAKKRTNFSMMNNRTRKILISVKSLNLGTKNIHAEFI